MQKQRQQSRGGIHDEAVGAGNERSHGKVAIEENAQLHDGFVIGEFSDDEQDESECGDGGRPANPGRLEPIRLLALVQHKLQRAQPERQQAKAEIIDGPLEELSQIRRVFDVEVHHEEGEDADGKIDIEDPAPGIAVGDPTAESGADDGGDDDTDTISGHRGAMLAGRETFQKDGLRQRLHSAAADALQNAGDNQHGHGQRHAAEQGCRSEDQDGD